MSATETPESSQASASRKRTRVESEDENSNCELVLEASCSVVTIAIVKSRTVEDTTYLTGFILTSEKNYCLVFAYVGNGGDKATQYFVHFKDERARTEAHVLVSDKSFFSILIVPTDKKHAAVVFDDDPPGYELIYTVGALAGSRLNAECNAPVMVELDGALGIYKGKVTCPSYAALDHNNKDVLGAEKYFQLTCDVHDDIITLDNVDVEDHKATIIVASPVFRLNGNSLGMIYSSGVYADIKDGMLPKGINSCIRSLLKIKTKAWERKVQKMATRWLKRNNSIMK